MLCREAAFFRICCGSIAYGPVGIEVLRDPSESVLAYGPQVLVALLHLGGFRGKQFRLAHVHEIGPEMKHERRLDIAGVQDIELKFTVYTSGRRKPVIVDLSEVSLITSMGLGMLITNAKTLQAQGIPFIILSPQPNVEKVLLMSGLQDLLPIEKDLASALDRIQNA